MSSANAQARPNPSTSAIGAPHQNFFVEPSPYLGIPCSRPIPPSYHIPPNSYPVNMPSNDNTFPQTPHPFPAMPMDAAIFNPSFRNPCFGTLPIHGRALVGYTAQRLPSVEELKLRYVLAIKQAILGIRVPGFVLSVQITGDGGLMASWLRI